MFLSLNCTKGTLITRASMDIEALQGNRLRPIPFLPHLESNGGEDVRVVHLIDRTGDMFYIPMRYCQTYYVNHPRPDLELVLTRIAGIPIIRRHLLPQNTGNRCRIT